MRSVILLAIGATLLASCGEEKEAAGPAIAADNAGRIPAVAEEGTSDSPSAPSMASSEPAALAQCKACHSFEKDGPTRLGPNLWGIHGSAAAARDGYAYSAALTGSSLVWTDNNLDAYLENPRRLVPGGKMSFSGIRDEGQRAEVVSYLATLTDENL